MKKINLFLPIAIVVLVFIFFKPIFLNGKLPIPSDTIVGLYHPFRDLYRLEFPRGIPFKNFLITDPVRQQYPWRYLSINIEKTFQLPLWNPYNLAGTPLLANFQTATFYPLNLLFFFLPFNLAWTLLIILEPVLGGLFMYLYLRRMKLSKIAGGLGALVFAFSGFSIAWMQWNTIFHVLLWLPLILLAKEHLLGKFSKTWLLIFVFSETSAIFAGHLQMLFYTFLVSNAYLAARIVQIYYQKKTPQNAILLFFNKYKVFLFIGAFVFILTAIQWYPTLQFISYSAREVDQIPWQKQEGWFIPLQNLIQFIVPDFFGNPATLNYWGVWNYAEFIGYISIFPLILALIAFFYRKDKKTAFYGGILLVALVFSLPTPLAKIPFLLDIPLISTSQPTRLMGIITFCLSILSALGLDYYLRHKQVRLPLFVLGVVFGLLWVYVLLGNKYFPFISLENIMVAKRNLILPTAIFVLSSSFLVFNQWTKNKKYSLVLIILLIGITTYDLFRLGDKFLPYTAQAYLYPQTKTLEFLQKNTGHYRIMAIDDRILPPNFSIMYKLQTVDGYDPLYLKRYGELIAASERGKPNIDPPFGFNRIITPKNYDSDIIDLLGVKYVLSLEDINSKKLKKVFQEGETRVYENLNIVERTFLVDEVCKELDSKEIMTFLFEKNLRKSAVVEDGEFVLCNEQTLTKPTISLSGTIRVIRYSENSVALEVVSNKQSLLLLTDSFYPTWKAKMDGKPAKIYRTDYNFRGVSVAGGRHLVEFYTTLL